MAGDGYESRFMAGGGAPLARDKFVSRSMLAILLGITAALVVGGIAFAIAAIPAAAAIWLGLSVPYTIMAVVFSVVRTTVTAEEIHVQYGLWGPRVPIDAITHCEAVDYDWKKYGGWGIRMGAGGVWAYAPTGTRRAVLLHYRDGGKDKKVVFAAEDADNLVRVIERARGGGARVAAVAELDALAEAELAEAALPEAEESEAPPRRAD
jgi:hypothetical protein